MPLFQHPDYNRKRDVFSRVRVRTSDPDQIKELKSKGYTQIPDDGVVLSSGDGVTEDQIKALSDMGIKTVGDLQNTDDTTLRQVKGVGPATIESLRKQG